MIPENLKITQQERDFLQKWVNICSEVLAEDESWEDGVMLKGLKKRMAHEDFTPSIHDIKQWYITTLISQDLVNYQKSAPPEEEKEKLGSLCTKLDDLMKHLGYSRVEKEEDNDLW